jgi:hypothetical protein
MEDGNVSGFVYADDSSPAAGVFVCWDRSASFSNSDFQSTGALSSHTDIPALRKDDAQEEEEKKNAGAYPAVGCVRGRGIE